MIINKIFGYDKIKVNQFGINYVMLFFVLALSWNIFIAGGTVFKGIVYMGNSILTTYTDFFSTQNSVTADIALSSSINLIHNIYRYLYYFVLICIAFGGIILLRNLVLNGQKRE